MAHNIQTMGYVGAVPWHGLGTFIRDQGLATSREMVVAAGLDWEVGIMETETFFWEPDPDGAMEIDPAAPGGMRPKMVKHYLKNSTKSVVRLDNLGVLDEGVSRFTPYQNWQMFEWVDAIVGSGAAVYHTAGALGFGETVWVLVELPGSIYVGDKKDEHKKFILIANSHKAGKALRFVRTKVRVVCQNTLNQALGGAALADIAVISHMPNISVRADEAKKQFGIINKHYDEIGNLFNALAGIQMDSRTLELGLEVAWVMPGEEADSAGAQARRVQVAKMREVTEQLFVSGAGQDLYPGSAYNFINAITDATSHLRGRRTAEAQMDYAMLGDGAKVQSRAMQFARALLNG